MWHTPAGDATGVTVFDALQPGRQIALFALVGATLSDPAAPAPTLTAAIEGALAAAFAQLRAWLEVELFDGAKTEWRSLILAAVTAAAAREGPLPDVGETNTDEWDLLIEEAEARLSWDADWEMGDVFFDLPPEQAPADTTLHGIDPEYFLAVPDDPNDVPLAAGRGPR